jgi:protein O-GlcNAc transferase
MSSGQNKAKESFNKGVAFHKSGQLNEAIKWYKITVEIQPENPAAFSNLGLVLHTLGKLEEAVINYKKAILIKPDFAEAYYNLGITLNEQLKLDEAVINYKKAISINPDFERAYYNLGIVFHEQGKLDKAIVSYKKAIEINPGFEKPYQRLIYELTFVDGVTGGEVLAQARKWGLLRDSTAKITKHNNIVDPQRRLRIGYVSPDFKEHAVAYLLEPLIANHNSQKVEIYCYAEVNKPDKVTERFISYNCHWRSTVGISDNKMVEMICEDQIDILLDCAGHTNGDRLAVFSKKPAPIQISYISMHGMPIGLNAIDYAISNQSVTSENFKNQIPEKIINIPQTDIAFLPNPDWPLSCGNIPDKNNGLIFACVGDPRKIQSSTIELWSELLDKIPGSKIIFKHRRYNTPEDRNRWKHIINQLNKRAVLEGIEGGWGKHMDFYNRIHIVLDTLPKTGCLTVLIPLWMGVPVVTMKNQQFFGQCLGSGVLTKAGIPELIADDNESYINIIIDLLNTPNKLSYPFTPNQPCE